MPNKYSDSEMKKTKKAGKKKLKEMTNALKPKASASNPTVTMGGTIYGNAGPKSKAGTDAGFAQKQEKQATDDDVRAIRKSIQNNPRLRGQKRTVKRKSR